MTVLLILVISINQSSAALFSTSIQVVSVVEKVQGDNVVLGLNMGRWELPKKYLPVSDFKPGNKISFELKLERYALLIQKYPPKSLGGSGGAGGGR